MCCKAIIILCMYSYTNVLCIASFIRNVRKSSMENLFIDFWKIPKSIQRYLKKQMNRARQRIRSAKFETREKRRIDSQNKRNKLPANKAQNVTVLLSIRFSISFSLVSFRLCMSYVATGKSIFFLYSHSTKTN